MVAHELGHHAHGHTWQRVRRQATSLVVAVLGAQASAAGPARWMGGTAGLTDPASLPWMLLAAGAVWLVTRPWQLAQSRAHEAEADAFALALTGRPEVLERVLRRIGKRNLSSDDDSLVDTCVFPYASTDSGAHRRRPACRRPRASGAVVSPHADSTRLRHVHACRPFAASGFARSTGGQLRRGEGPGLHPAADPRPRRIGGANEGRVAVARGRNCSTSLPRTCTGARQPACRRRRSRRSMRPVAVLDGRAWRQQWRLEWDVGRRSTCWSTARATIGRCRSSSG